MNENLARPRLVMAVNSAIAVGFLQGQLQFFQDKGFDVTVLCPERRKDEWEVAQPEGIPMIQVTMARVIAPLQDLVSLCAYGAPCAGFARLLLMWELRMQGCWAALQLGSTVCVSVYTRYTVCDSRLPRD